MKRLSTLFFVACLFTLTALAHEISAEQSLRKAVEKISEKSYAKRVHGKADFALVHTKKSANNGKALYYVFSNEKNGGFVITGADHRANSILGYTENGTFEQALAIPAFRSWLGSCEAAMQWLCDKADTAAETNHPHFNIPDQVVTNADNTINMTIPGRHYAEDNTLPASIEPLLGGITWNQRDPYDRLCPEFVVDGQTIKCATGCVATATAQVMKYYEWPKQGTGSYKYTSHGTVSVDLEADFSQSVYDWDNMLDDYSGDFTDEQANAVAKLMSDVGIAERMNYDEESSSAHQWTTYALATYFGYNKGMQMCCREYYTYAEWNNLLKKELAESRPVLYKGVNKRKNAGHEFVLDGYDEDGNFHVNWGWGGMSNGYFDINYMDPANQGTGGSNGGYPAEQQININCFPDKDGTSVAHHHLVVSSEPTLREDAMVVCQISNIGLASYQGKAGFVAMIDNEIVGSVTDDVEMLDFMRIIQVEFTLDDLGLTPEMIGDKKCIIYPVFLDGEDYKVPQSMVAFQNYVMFSIDEDCNILIETTPEENANPVCESIEITRDYGGFNIKGKAVISNEEGRPDFDRQIMMFILDDNKISAVGQNFAFVNAGESREIEFSCDPLSGNTLEIGKTYNVALIYTVCGENLIITGSETTVTIKDPGAAPVLSYSDFALDKTSIAPNEDITVSFNVENTGGFGIETFYVAIFKKGASTSLDVFSVEADLPTGTTTVSKTNKLDYEEGSYMIGVYTRTANGEWNRLNPEDLEFTIKDPATAIGNVIDNTNVSNYYYDLQGRRVANPTKGLYIVNGKKFVKE